MEQVLWLIGIPKVIVKDAEQKSIGARLKIKRICRLVLKKNLFGKGLASQKKHLSRTLLLAHMQMNSEHNIENGLKVLKQRTNDWARGGQFKIKKISNKERKVFDTPRKIISVDDIKQKLRAGFNQSQIAEIFKVTKQCISKKIKRALINDDELDDLHQRPRQEKGYKLRCQNCGFRFYRKMIWDDEMVEMIECPKCNKLFRDMELKEKDEKNDWYYLQIQRKN